MLKIDEHKLPAIIAGIASCGCVYHAEDGIPCEHDKLLWELSSNEFKQQLLNQQ